MNFITRLDDSYAWMRSRGRYRQVNLFVRGEAVFAQWGSSYIRLNVNGATSDPNVSWIEVDLPLHVVVEIENGLAPRYRTGNQAEPALAKTA